MARRHKNELMTQIRRLERYTDEDLSDSAVHHLAVLAVKASEDKSTADKIVRAFGETVGHLPPTDRVKFLYAIIAGLTIIILGGMVLKALGLW